MADLAQLERALINADKAGDTAGATVLAGEIRRMRASTAEEFVRSKPGPAQPPPKPFVPSGEREQPSWTSPEGIAGNPVTRFALGAASPIIGGAQALQNLPNIPGPLALAKAVTRPFSNERVAQLEGMKQEGMRQQGAEGIDWAGLAGAAASPAVWSAAKALPAATSTAQRIGQGAMMGGVFGAATPVTQEGDFWGTKAAQAGTGLAVGAAIPAGIGAAQFGARTVRNIADPFLPGGVDRTVGRTAVAAAGDKNAEIVRLLREGKQIVPGSAPTAGEAAAPAGRAEFSGLQEAVRPHQPTSFDAVTQAQNAARVQALRGISSSTGFDNPAMPPMKAAEMVRGANAQANYGAVRNDLISPIAPEDALAQRISGKYGSKVEAMRDAGRFATTAAQQEQLSNKFAPVSGYPRVPARLSPNLDRVPEANRAYHDSLVIARQRGVEKEFLDFQLDSLMKEVGKESPKLTTMLNRPSMRDALQEAMKGADETGAYFPSKAGEPFSVSNLQRMKQALDDIVKDPQTFGLKGTQIQEIQGTRDAFVSWLSNRSPGWAKARNAYAADSIPINQMQVGQYLEGKLVSPLSEEGGAQTAQRAALYAQALRDAPGTLKRATGQPRYEELGEVLSPTQVRSAQNVGADLGRTAEHDRLARLGASKARELLGQTAPTAPALGMFNPKYSVLKSLTNRLAGRVEGKSIERLADLMRDPQKLADLMEKAAMPLPERQAVMAELLRRGLPGVAGQGASGAINY